jgi:guanylate kinase
VDGETYHFLSEEDFAARVERGEFLEWADVHGHRYGTLKSEVDQRIADGKSVILEIDVQGAFNVRRVYPDAVLIFIEPPSAAVLEERLRGRGTEDEASVELRLSNARDEMRLASKYDARVVNDDLSQATEDLARLLDLYETNGGNSQDGSY